MSKYIIDANVSLLPGMSVKNIPDNQTECALKCSQFLENFMKDSQSRLVLDEGGEILKEYRNAYNLNNNQGIAVEFYKWANAMFFKYIEDVIPLEELQENEFANYPDCDDLKNFDPPDRKYIALSYNHPEKPPIIEAGDSKWWRIRDAMRENGMEIIFIDENYIKRTYMKKMKH